MSISPIPLVAGTPQTFNATLGNKEYQLTLQYRNDSLTPGWVLDIADASGNDILTGVPLVTGADLLAQYRYLGFGGSIFVQTTNDPDAVPTFENLGANGQIYWVQNP